MLSDFFRINFPYGIERKEGTNEWMAFNREYMPLGFNDSEFKRAGSPGQSFTELPIFTKYRNLTEAILKVLACDNSSALRNGKDGKIDMVFFYDDASNPVNGQNINERNTLFDLYCKKLRVLADLKV